MNSEIYNQAEKFVFDSFNSIGASSQLDHFIRTVYWLKVLSSEADEALLVAAVSHDIERAFRKDDVLEKRKAAGLADLDFLRAHEERGAEIIAKFLRSTGAGEDFIERVIMLVSRHEEGGNDDQNLLKDADSLSFFENNVPLFLKKVSSELGKEKVKEKFDWMFERITSEEAKEIAKPFYEEAIRGLNIN